MENATNIALAVICFAGAAVLMGMLVVFVSLRIVPPDKRLSVHRLGQYLGDKGPGLVILIPFIDRGVMKEAGAPEKHPSEE
jgi:regulator of protease activity HflC (stomatin/prohibitin superfamily)